MKKMTAICGVMLAFFSATAADNHMNLGPRVIPLLLGQEVATDLDLLPGDEVWFEMEYCGSPDGEPIHREIAERLWWVQETPLMVLGSTGLPLPSQVLRRATVYVRVYWDGEEIVSDPYMLTPQIDAVTIGPDPANLQSELAKRLSSVDAGYLSQLVHYMAGNLSSLEVQGTSYAIDGVGTVIDNNGDWVGGRLAMDLGQSVFVGSGAGINDDLTNNRNVFLGVQSGHNSTTGVFNVAAGYRAMYGNTEGTANTATGYRALEFNTAGECNTASGCRALRENTTGSRNTAIGYEALEANTEGQFNTAVGSQSLEANTTGANNVAVGNEAMTANTIGERNTAIGFYALGNNSTGESNTAIGYRALAANTEGQFNTAVGRDALRENDTGDASTATGWGALLSNTTGFQNSAFGQRALHSNTEGTFNSAFGATALFENTTGSSNTALGFQALLNNTSGSLNTAMGYGALSSNTTGGQNVASGQGALGGNTTGTRNTTSGVEALGWNTTGSYNTASGFHALRNNSTGIYNVAIGFMSGPGYGPFDLNNTSALGSDTVVTASHQVRIGNESVTSIGGQVGWSTLSDGRFKTEVQESVLGLDFILDLRPVQYRLDLAACRQFLNQSAEKRDSGPSMSQVHSGFIAQDVAKTAQKHGLSFSGVDAPPNAQTPFALRYAQFVVPLVKAVQELQQQLDAERQRIEELETRLREM